MSQAALSVIPDTRLPPLRFITAASLFDGHDASINIMRRMLQASGVEVIHLGHNRSVAEIVSAAVQEDVQGIAISSYQGGHVEFFRFMVDTLRERCRVETGLILQRELMMGALMVALMMVLMVAMVAEG